MAWNLYHTSTPSGSVGAVSAGQVLFDNWTDVTGSAWAVVSGALQAQGTRAYNTSFLTRPSGENRQDQRIVTMFTGAAAQTCFNVHRYVSASTQYLVQWNPAGTQLQLYKNVGGSITQLGTTQTVSFTAGHNYTVDSAATGVSPTTITVTVTDTTTSTVLLNNYSATDSDAALQVSAGYALSSGSTDAANITQVALYNTDAASMAASPSTLNANEAGQTVTLTGTGTAWTGGTTFSLSGVAGCSITSTTVNSATSATLTITTGTSTGTLTIADSVDSATATVSVSWPSLAVAVNDANLFLSPYTWLVSGGASAQTNCFGAYLKLWFQAGAGVTLNVDTSPLAGAAASAYPTLAWSLDGAAFALAQLTSGQTSLSLETVSAGSHALFLYVKDNSGNVDEWAFSAAPYAAVKITGLVLGGGATQPLVQAAQARSKRLLVYGDSITCGYNTGGAGSNDAFLTYAFRLAEALGAEVGVVAFGGTGWQWANGQNVPPLYTSGNDAQSSWNKYWAGQSRLSGGLLTPTPDYVVLLHGTNDGTNGVSDSAVTTQATAFLPALRAVTGASCKIALCIPPGRFKKSALAAATLPDARVKLIDLGEEQATGLTNAPAGDGTAAGAAGWKASDGLHPLAVAHAQIGARLAQAIASAFLAQRVGMGGGANA